MPTTGLLGTLFEEDRNDRIDSPDNVNTVVKSSLLKHIYTFIWSG